MPIPIEGVRQFLFIVSLSSWRRACCPRVISNTKGAFVPPAYRLMELLAGHPIFPDVPFLR